MKNILVIAGKAGMAAFDPRAIEEPFEDWLMERFDFMLFHRDIDFENWKDRQSSEAPDRFWAELPMPDRRKRA